VVHGSMAISANVYLSLLPLACSAQVVAVEPADAPAVSGRLDPERIQGTAADSVDPPSAIGGSGSVSVVDEVLQVGRGWNQGEQQGHPHMARLPHKSHMLACQPLPRPEPHLLLFLSLACLLSGPKVTRDEAQTAARRLALQEGLLVDLPSGAAVHAALSISGRTGNEGRLVVVILPSFGERLFSTR
jgi:hypothetical protein